MGIFLKWTQTTVKTANYFASFGETVRCDPTGGAFQITLPHGTSADDGRQVKVKNQSTSTNNITVVGQDSSTTDGGASVIMATSRMCLTFEYSNTSNDWTITAKYS